MRPKVPLLAGAGMATAAVVIMPALHHAGALPHPSAARVAAAAVRPVVPVVQPVAPVRHIVVLGDSVAAGEGQSGPDYGALVAQQLSRPGVDVSSTNLAQDGLTAVQLADQVQHDAATREAIRTADVVVITAGANDAFEDVGDDPGQDCADACVAAVTRRVSSSLDSTLAQIKALQQRPGACVLTTSYWNVGLDGQVAHSTEDQASYAWFERTTLAINDAIRGSSARAGATMIDLRQSFRGDGSKDATPLLSPDGDHPDEDGQQLIAGQIVAALQR
ncbi:SGNH/GDSL hydrolase family protein [Arsenicicoccus sp. oral taxon 190]|uniref:SGNH/GDSL hydrolase family protein n=1 Tax=Arsenicicoccus sp. oral taxon 190 TaxID=1658671 RepID=UPI00067A1033|nr:SGNH/GDSL hydrolase family protein [Arsenicicoccus sp. oral taxon 190]AKT51567.1 hypothetical protein ADJ73_10125 [Arsenicicoccus sp. oral taxon 190]